VLLLRDPPTPRQIADRNLARIGSTRRRWRDRGGASALSWPDACVRAPDAASHNRFAEIISPSVGSFQNLNCRFMPDGGGQLAWAVYAPGGTLALGGSYADAVCSSENAI
jgi:hypothetical protein